MVMVVVMRRAIIHKWCVTQVLTTIAVHLVLRLGVASAVCSREQQTCSTNITNRGGVAEEVCLL